MRGPIAQQLASTEVAKHRVAVGAKEDVGRLYVAMEKLYVIVQVKERLPNLDVH